MGNLKMLNLISFFMCYKYIINFVFIILVLVNFSTLRNILLQAYNFILLTKIALVNEFLSKLYKFTIETQFLFFLFFLFYITNVLFAPELLIDVISSWSFFTFVIYFFCFFVYMFKYNLNFFSFLELSNTDAYVHKYISKQYLRDTTNFLAHILRLLLLFLRLNIYDGLDDIFDSYYIFVGDFNIYEYYD